MSSVTSALRSSVRSIGVASAISTNAYEPYAAGAITEEQAIGRFLLPRKTYQVVPEHAQGVCLARQETIVLKPGQGFLCQLATGKKVALPILKPRQRNLTVGC